MNWDRFEKIQIIKGINADNAEIAKKLASLDKGYLIGVESKEKLLGLLELNNKYLEQIRNK